MEANEKEERILAKIGEKVITTRQREDTYEKQKRMGKTKKPKKESGREGTVRWTAEAKKTECNSPKGPIVDVKKMAGERQKHLKRRVREKHATTCS